MSEQNISYWNLTRNKAFYPTLNQNLKTEVLIIGGGMVGVSCAYCLATNGIQCVLVEAGELAGGTTGNTTGKITQQHGIIYSKIHEKYGLEAARQYAESQRKGMEFVEAVCREESIACDLVQNTAHIYGVNQEEWDTLEKEYRVAKKIGIEAELGRNLAPLPGSIGALAFENQLVFHPVRYVVGLAEAAAKRGAAIYCHTKAVRLEEEGEKRTVHMENETIVEAKHIIFATQYPVLDGPSLFFTRLYPKRTYGIAVQAKRDWPEGSFINVGDPSRSLRTHVDQGKKILIAVGESHDTGRGPEDMSVHFDHLVRFAQEVAGVETVLARWSAQDYDTPDELPYIGRHSEDSRVYIAAGFRKWGLSNGALAGLMLTDLIATGRCQYQELYARSRPDFASSLGKAIAGATIPVGELIKSKFEGFEDVEGLKPGQGRVIRFQGQRAGIYMDEDGQVTVLDITCTHMGTELNFNSAEKTWDCPAHGGRFNTRGEHLEGPPRHNLEILYQGSLKDMPE